MPEATVLDIGDKVARQALKVHAGYKGLHTSQIWSSGAYERILRAVVARLEVIGQPASVEPYIESGVHSFDVCNAFTIRYAGLTMAYLHQENDRCPASWEKPLGAFDLILAPSPHIIEVMQRSATQTPVAETSLTGVAPAVFHPAVAPLDDLFPGRFKFLMVGATQPRKNTATLVRVFLERFRRNDDVVLILKSGGYGEDSVHRELIGGASNVVLVSDELPDATMAAMYRSVAVEGAYVHPHRAECVGMPVLEALACGCRVGVTGWGGPGLLSEVDGLTRFPYELVPSEFMNAPGSSIYGPGEVPLWAEPSEEAIGEWMTEVAFTTADPASGATRAEMVHQRYSYPGLVDGFVQFLRDLDVEVA